ncbi:MAG: hypothetical protein J2P13_10445, partial [Acidobacteria bacterium]|nr:hypothetical protein [Acidobacteriota bacterium]
PGVEKLLHPQLFPSGGEFFESHAGLTLFPDLIAFSVRLTHLKLEDALFAWHLASIFLFLLAGWELAGACFERALARWGAVALLASLFTLPVAGTALYLIDQYLNPRNLAAFAGVFALARVVERKYLRAGVWLLAALAVHPLMTWFAASICILLVLVEKIRLPRLSELQWAAVFPLSFASFFAPPTPAYREAMRFHVSHFLSHWSWYEWLGAVGPAVILVGYGRLARSRRLANLERLCFALVIYTLAYFAAALVISLPERFAPLARIQPLRSLHLVYVVLLTLTGALLAEYVLKNRVWRWIGLFLPLCAGMFLAQRALFPRSAHIEWPWAKPENAWEQAFLWIRGNTPQDAQFAIDPFYMGISGEGYTGFRAAAQRSRLADAHKDSGAVSMFPPLAEEWWHQFQAQKNWKDFRMEDFLRLRAQYGINWIVIENPVPGLRCAYRNPAVSVCRLGAQENSD